MLFNILGVALLLGACSLIEIEDAALTTFEPAGPFADQIDGLFWMVFWIATAVFVLVMGVVVLVQELWTDITTPYEDYPAWMLGLFGWGASVAVAVLGFLLARIAWRTGTSLDPQPSPQPVGREGGRSWGF